MVGPLTCPTSVAAMVLAKALSAALSTALYGGVSSIGDDDPPNDGNKLLIGRAIGYQRAGEAARSLRLLDRAVRVHPDDAELWLFRGRYRVETHDCAGAASDFQKAEALQPRNASAFASEGLARLCSGDRGAARTAFARSLSLDPNQPKIREFMNTLGRQE